jgi:hypothetical protein
MKRPTTALITFAFTSLCTISTLYSQENTKLEVPPVIVIKNVHVWDGTSDTLQKDTDVLIVGDKIKQVAKNIPTGGDYQVDAVRKTSKKVAGGTATGNFLSSLSRAARSTRTNSANDRGHAAGRSQDRPFCISRSWSDSVDLRLWRSLGTRYSHEVVGDF